MFSWNEKQGTGNWGLILSTPPQVSIPEVIDESSEITNTPANSYNVPIPTGNVGDLLLSIVHVHDSGHVWTVDGGSGDWTDLPAVAGDGGQCEQIATYKTADGTEGATVTISHDLTVQKAAYGTLRIRGHNPLQALEQSTGAAATDDSPDPDSITPSWGAFATLYIAAFTNDGRDPNFLSGPTGYTFQWAYDSPQSGSAGMGCGVQSRADANGGIEDPSSFLITFAEQWAAYTIAIKGNSGASINSTALLNEAGTLDPAPTQQRLDEANLMITEDGKIIFTE